MTRRKSRISRSSIDRSTKCTWGTSSNLRLLSSSRRNSLRKSRTRANRSTRRNLLIGERRSLLCSRMLLSRKPKKSRSNSRTSRRRNARGKSWTARSARKMRRRRWRTSMANVLAGRTRPTPINHLNPTSSRIK